MTQANLVRGSAEVTLKEKALISVEGLFWSHIIKTIPVKEPTNNRLPSLLPGLL